MGRERGRLATPGGSGMMALGTLGTEGGKHGGRHGGCYFAMFLVGYAQVPPSSVPSVHNLFARPRGSAVAGRLRWFLYSSSLEELEGRRIEVANPSNAEVFAPSDRSSDHVPLGFGDGGSPAAPPGHRGAERQPTAPSCLLKKRAETAAAGPRRGPANWQLAGLRPQTPSAASHFGGCAPIKTVKSTGNLSGKRYGTNDEQ